MNNNEIRIELKDNRILTANLEVPDEAKGLVIFAHGSGSSRMSPRNNYVAQLLNKQHMATLLADLLTPFEDEIYENRFNIALLSNRLIDITEWALQQSSLRYLPTGYFGASTGAAAALQAAVILDNNIQAVVSRGGRPDMANHTLQQVKTPTLFIIGSRDNHVVELNKLAYNKLGGEKKIEIVEGASHLFEEAGALDRVAQLAAAWFDRHLYVSTFLQQDARH